MHGMYSYLRCLECFLVVVSLLEREFAISHPLQAWIVRSLPYYTQDSPGGVEESVLVHGTMRVSGRARDDLNGHGYTILAMLIKS